MSTNIPDTSIRKYDAKLPKFQQAWKYNIPIHAHIEVAYHCNEKCPHCYEVFQQRQTLTNEQILNILDQLAKAGTIFLIISGGEIFARRGILTIIEHAKKLGFAYRLFTNCTLVTTEVAKKVADLHPIEVETSIYGEKAETHDKMTLMKGSFEKTLAGVRNLRQVGVKVLMKAVVTKDNVYEISGMRKLAQDLGASFLSNPLITPKEDGSGTALHLRVSDHQLMDYCLEDESNITSPKTRPLDQPMCSVGKSVVGISPYGDVFPCAVLRKSIGNLQTQTFEEIWFGRPDPFLTEIRNIKFGDLNSCSSCEQSNHCMVCIGANYLENGDYRIPSTESKRIALQVKQAHNHFVQIKRLSQQNTEQHI